MAASAKGLGSGFTTRKLVDVLLPLFLLAALTALCIQLLIPFLALLLWAIIVAICLYPIHLRLTGRGWTPRRSASVIGLFLATFILAPTVIAVTSAASAVPDLLAMFRGDAPIPPPPAGLAKLPVIGEKAHAIWMQAVSDFPAFRQQYGPQLASFARWMFREAAGTFVTVLGFVGAVIVAAICLAYSTTIKGLILRIFGRITGSLDQANHYMALIGGTVRSVANGVIGVAFVQALLVGVGFFVAGVPGAGLLSLAAMALGVLQVPVLIVTLPAIIWVFAAKSLTVAIIFTVWSIIAGLSDVALKPLLIGHGLEVPMPVILLGVIGGVIAYGLVGLFIGAVLLAVGYVLFCEWLDAPLPSAGGGSGTLRAAE